MSSSKSIKAPSEKSMKELAQDKLNNGNPSQLGDPVSLKAETANSHPTEQDRGAASASPAKKTTSGSKTGGGGGVGADKDSQALAKVYDNSAKPTASGTHAGGSSGVDSAKETQALSQVYSGAVKKKTGENVWKETGHGAPKADGTGGGEGEGKGKKTLAQSYQESNKTMLGDPVSLKAEKADSEPTEQDRGAMSMEERKKRGSKL